MPENTSERNRSEIVYEDSGPNTVRIIVRDDGVRKSIDARIFSQDQVEKLIKINSESAETA